MESTSLRGVDCDNMKKKIKFGVLLLVFLLILNAVIGGVLVVFIQTIKVPHIEVDFDLKQLTRDELTFTTTILMRNDNSFELLINTLKIIGKTAKGDTILDINFPGGAIAANQETTFHMNDSLAFKGEFSTMIFTSLQGMFGVKIAGIYERTMPFHVNITASLQNLFQDISTPHISIGAEVSRVTDEGILFQGIISIENPNRFEMSLEKLTALIETETGEPVGEISVQEDVIKPLDTTHFRFNGTLLYKALNAKTLHLHLNGSASVRLMGINKSIALSTTAQMIVPEINELLFQNESLNISIGLELKMRLRGVQTTIGLTLYNPSVVPLQANDMICTIYGVTNQNQKLIIQQPMQPCTIDATKEQCQQITVRIPYLKIFTAGTKKLLPDWFMIQIQGNLSIAGVNQSIPISINANINPHFIR